MNITVRNIVHTVQTCNNILLKHTSLLHNIFYIGEKKIMLNKLANVIKITAVVLSFKDGWMVRVKTLKFYIK